MTGGSHDGEALRTLGPMTDGAGQTDGARRVMGGTDPAGLEALDAWVAERRAVEAIAERRRAWWLRQQHERDATLAGVLLALAERAATVVVATTGGRRHRGTVELVGTDVVAVRTGRRRVLVALGAVATVRSEPGGGPVPADGDRTVASGVTLGGMLADALEDRPTVTVAVHGEHPVTGVLVAVGRDAVTVDPQGAVTGPVVVALHAVSDVEFNVSG